MGSSLSRSINERRVDVVAVTLHPVLTVSTVFVGTVDHHWKLDDPLVTAVGRRDIVSNLTTPAGAEFVLDLAAPLGHRDDVREVVSVE